MPKLLEINSTLNWGSTGHIVEQICDMAAADGWECCIAHGARYTNPSKYKTIEIGNKISNYLDVARSMLWGRMVWGGGIATRQFIRKIKDYQPDLIHIHNVHGYYINIDLLFSYLKKAKIPVVWTLHDCWTMTGQCTHFDVIGCERWMNYCHNCPQLHTGYKSLLFDRSRSNFERKKSIFNGVESLTIVTVSKWLQDIVSHSFLKRYPHIIINNGIDISVFSPCENELRNRLGLNNKILLLGVSMGWSKYKGYFDFLKLSENLSDEYRIVLIGLSKEQISSLPSNIIGIERTNNQKELVEFYTEADVFLNPTYNDSFPTTNLEALACGTPIITYRTGGSPEAIDSDTGVVVEKGDFDNFVRAVVNMSNKVKIYRDEIKKSCRNRAELLFNKNDRFLDYVDLFNNMMR